MAAQHQIAEIYPENRLDNHIRDVIAARVPANDRCVRICSAGPPTPPGKHIGKGEEKALTEAVNNTAMA